MKISFNYLDTKDNVNIQNGFRGGYPKKNHKSGIIKDSIKNIVYILFS